MTTSHAIHASGLQKSFGDHRVLDGLDLDVAAGSVLALLGPNGSGKTTTVRILATLLSADVGTAEVAGFDVHDSPDEVRARIGVTGQFAALDTLMTGRENLRLIADLQHLDRPTGRRRVTDLLERFGLADAADRAAATYSGGMRRRLDLAMTLVGRPQVIFLDEPTTGLDPRSRRQLWDVVHDLVADGVAVLLTTQYLEEADALADQIAVLDGGQIVAAGTPAELRAHAPGAHLRIEFRDDDALTEARRALAGAQPDPAGRVLRVPSGGGLTDIRRAIDALDERTVTAFEVHTPDLDDVFLALTGHGTTVVDESTPEEVSA